METFIISHNQFVYTYALFSTNEYLRINKTSNAMDKEDRREEYIEKYRLLWFILTDELNVV